MEVLQDIGIVKFQQFDWECESGPTAFSFAMLRIASVISIVVGMSPSESATGRAGKCSMMGGSSFLWRFRV